MKQTSYNSVAPLPFKRDIRPVYVVLWKANIVSCCLLQYGPATNVRIYGVCWSLYSLYTMLNVPSLF